MKNIDLSPNSTDLRKLRRQARSKVKFSAIIEAVEIYGNQRINWYPDFFQSSMESRGWEYIGSGLYKICMAKNSIVIKFPRISMGEEALKELAREYDQWMNPPRDLRKYLPRTYALMDGRIIIQDKVLQKCIIRFNVERGYETCSRQSEVNDIASRYHLQDFYQNHGHTSKGNVKFFDSVWDRWREIDL
jgi:hypothetical protein